MLEFLLAIPLVRHIHRAQGQDVGFALTKLQAERPERQTNTLICARSTPGDRTIEIEEQLLHFWEITHLGMDIRRNQLRQLFSITKLKPLRHPQMRAYEPCVDAVGVLMFLLHVSVENDFCS